MTDRVPMAICAIYSLHLLVPGDDDGFMLLHDYFESELLSRRGAVINTLPRKIPPGVPSG